MLREYGIPDMSENDLVTVVDNICGGELSGEWSIEPIGSCIGTATLGIYRVSESAVRKTGESVGWSTVLKIIDADKDPSGQCECRMMVSAYLHSLDSRVRPDIYYEATESASNERWIWMEDWSSEVQPPPNPLPLKISLQKINTRVLTKMCLRYLEVPDQRPRDHEPLNLRCPLVNLGYTLITIYALNR